jgi:hypothetical protein
VLDVLGGQLPQLPGQPPAPACGQQRAEFRAGLPSRARDEERTKGLFQTLAGP